MEEIKMVFTGEESSEGRVKIDFNSVAIRFSALGYIVLRDGRTIVVRQNLGGHRHPPGPSLKEFFTSEVIEQIRFCGVDVSCK